MHAREELSRSSEFQLELLSDQQTVINLDDILGKNVTVKSRCRTTSTRYFNGFVTRFSAGGAHRPLSPLSRDGVARGCGF